MSAVLILGIVMTGDASRSPGSGSGSSSASSVAVSRAGPDPGRHRAHRPGGEDRAGRGLRAAQAAQVTVPGTAHFFVMWAFFILATVYVEAYAVLFSRNPEWSWFVFGNWALLGFLQDFIAVMCLLGLVVFWAIRLRNQPQQMGRKSRFFGSHLGPAYFTLFMIFNVIWTMFLFRGAVEARVQATDGDSGYGKAAFVSYALGTVLPDSTALIGIGLLLHIGVMLVFLIFVLNSKHLPHLRRADQRALLATAGGAGRRQPLISAGKPVTLDDIDDLDEDAKLGVGAVEDFTWKGLLDFATCTECGRCQSQCPRGTPRSRSRPLMIMAMRDASFAKAPYLLADEGKREALLEGNDTLTKEVERPLVGDTGDDWFYMPESGAASSTPTCSGPASPAVRASTSAPGRHRARGPHRRHAPLPGARRVQLPQRAQPALPRPREQRQPWNMSPNARLDWAKGLDFEVKVVGEHRVPRRGRLAVLGRVRGAYEDRAKKTTRAVAELLDIAG